MSKGLDLNPLLSGRGSPWVTALRWGPFNFSRCDVVGIMRAEYTKPRGPCHCAQSRFTGHSNVRRQSTQHLAVRIQYGHLTDAEFADRGLDRGQVAYDDPCERI